MKSNRNINLIECHDHKFAPWSIICNHLINNESTEWIGLKSSNPEVDHDWVCPQCAEDIAENRTNIKNLKAVCIHCTRHLRKKFDPEFKD